MIDNRIVLPLDAVRVAASALCEWECWIGTWPVASEDHKPACLIPLLDARDALLANGIPTGQISTDCRDGKHAGMACTGLHLRLPPAQHEAAMTKTCSYEGCAKKTKCKELCSMHYTRLWRTGSPAPALTSFESGEARFLQHYKPGEPDACWEWTGWRNNSGYGAIGKVYAHRTSWERANGRPVPAGLFVLHACDNPPCVNPAHLRVGTHQENTQDAHDRNRWSRVQRNVKLTADQVWEIRRLLAEGHSHAATAAKFGVGKSTVTGINRGATWGWLT